MARCIFCGYCEIACPFDAITLGNDFELSEMSRERAGLHQGDAARRRRRSRGARPRPRSTVRRGGLERRIRDDLIGAGTAETIVFIAATALAIASALAVVLSGNPFLSALSLILNLASLATLYLLLKADFVAAAQVIVYAGAVMIMFLFVIAYLGGAADEPSRDTPAWQLAAALIAGGAPVGRDRAGDHVPRVRRRAATSQAASAAPRPSRCRCS